jgi:hypothetical protein
MVQLNLLAYVGKALPLFSSWGKKEDKNHLLALSCTGQVHSNNDGGDDDALSLTGLSTAVIFTELLSQADKMLLRNPGHGPFCSYH